MSANDWEEYPESFCRELGKFALIFADAEGVAGELIVVDRGTSTPMKGDWSRSGQQLITALREVHEFENFQLMCDDFEKLTATRNLFMHGEWRFGSERSAAIFKRSHDRTSNLPGYQMAVDLTPEKIRNHSFALLQIRDALGMYLSDRMGISR